MTSRNDDYARFTEGQKIRVTGTKGNFLGTTVLLDAKYQLLEGSYIAEATDYTDVF